MSYTYPELLEKLKQEEEVILIEVLGITSEDIVDRFEDLIEDKLDELFANYELDLEDENQLWEDRS